MHLDILYSHVGMIDYPRGVFYRSISLAQELSRRGHNVTFLATQQTGFSFPWKVEYRDGVKVVIFPSILPSKIRRLGYAILPIILKVLYILNKKYDIYHCDHHRPVSFFCALAGRFIHGGKVIIEWMDYMGKGSQYAYKSPLWKMTIGPLDNYLETKSNVIADGVVVISEFLRTRTIEQGVCVKDIIKIWGASDVNAINFLENKNLSREKHRLPTDKFIINLANMSNFEIEYYYSHIFTLLKKLSATQLVAVVKTGKESSKLKDMGERLGIPIFQYGSKPYDDYCELLSLSDCFILFQEESLRELSRWPNVIGDFLATGNPTLIQPVGDAKECADRYPSAFVRIDSIDRISACKVDELRKKTTLSNRKKIRQVAEKEFSWKHRGNSLEDFYIRYANVG